MADAPIIPDEAEVRARWGAFQWNEDSKAKRDAILSRYPAGREQSASIPLLDLAQRLDLIVVAARTAATARRGGVAVARILCTVVGIVVVPVV